MRTQIFDLYNDRPSANKTAIVITDGKPTSPATVPDQVALDNQAGITTYVVGVTNQVDEAILKNISSPPNQVQHILAISIQFPNFPQYI